MRTRFLGILLIALVALGGLNFAQAIRQHFTSEPALAKLPSLPNLPNLPPLPPVTRVGHESSAAMEVMIDESFKVNRGDLLDVDVQHANIVVRTSESDEARIVIRLESDNMSRARDLFADMDFRVERDGDRIVIRSDEPRRMNWRTNMNIEVEARIPAEFDLAMVTTHGDVLIDDLKGRVDVESTHGDVSARSISGSSIAFTTTHGDLEAEDLTAGSVSLETTHGDIMVERVAADEFDASTTHSDVHIGELSARSAIETTHGDVMIRLGEARDLDISTTHGEVDLYLDESMGADLDLRGSEVLLPASANFSGTLKEESARGTFNGGGPRIAVSTSFGEVTIHRK